jgi:hypothetical protein
VMHQLSAEQNGAAPADSAVTEAPPRRKAGLA